MKIFYLFALPLLAITFSCRTANKAYQRGNYNEAIDLSIRKLQKDPYDGESRSVLMAAYKNTIAESEDKVRILNKSSNESRHEDTYNEYRKLQNLYERLRANPAISNFAKPRDYSDQLNEYGRKAADVYYERGMLLMAKNTKQYNRQAYHEFKKCLQFPSYKPETKDRIEEAFNAAIVHIVISPMQNNYGTYAQQSSYKFRNFEEQIIRNLRNNLGNEFLHIYTKAEAEGRKIVPDEIMEMQFGRFEIGRPEDKMKTRNVTKEVVVKETVYKPDSVVKQYAKVSAQITRTERTWLSQGELMLTMRNPQGRVVWNDRVLGEHRSQTGFSIFSGDERALSDTDREELNKRETKLPSEEEITNDILRDLENGTRQRIREYVNRVY